MICVIPRLHYSELWLQRLPCRHNLAIPAAKSLTKSLPPVRSPPSAHTLYIFTGANSYDSQIPWLRGGRSDGRRGMAQVRPGHARPDGRAAGARRQPAPAHRRAPVSHRGGAGQEGPLRQLRLGVQGCRGADRRDCRAARCGCRGARRHGRRGGQPRRAADCLLRRSCRQPAGAVSRAHLRLRPVCVPAGAFGFCGRGAGHGPCRAARAAAGRHACVLRALGVCRHR